MSAKNENPWSCGDGKGCYCDAESRADMVKNCEDLKLLAACLKWPDTQKSVKLQIERRLKKLAAGQKEPVVRECVSADSVLPPEAATPYAPEMVTAQYRRAVAGALEMVRFGAMLVEIDMSLTRETHNGGCCQTGETLKGWLAANVPDVNYKTAMRMKGSAEAVAAGIGASPSELLRALNPDPKALPDEEDGERLVAVRERLVEIVHGRSERSLVLWMKGGAPALPEGGDAEDTGKADEIALDAARRFGRSAADALKCMDARKRKALTAALAGALREALGLKGLAWLAKVLEEAEG